MSYTINDLKIGQTASYSKTIAETDVYLFAGITGDFNPVHMNAVHAEQSMFKNRIAHGMLSASMISTVLGTQLPGPGTIYLSQQVKFLSPVYFGDTITAIVEVKELDQETSRAVISTYCLNQHGKKVLDGEAKVMVPKKL